MAFSPDEVGRGKIDKGFQDEQGFHAEGIGVSRLRDADTARDLRKSAAGTDRHWPVLWHLQRAKLSEAGKQAFPSPGNERGGMVSPGQCLWLVC